MLPIPERNGQVDRFSNWRLFARVVEAGSFSAAARQLEITQPQVSKVVAALETELRVRLVERSARGLRVTAEGQRFYEQCRRVLRLQEEVVHDLPSGGPLRGPLRLSCPVGYGNLHVVPLLVRFLELHPQVELDLDLNDAFVDLVAQGFDLAVRIGGNSSSLYTVTEVARAEQALVAAPEYLDRRGEPTRPEQLSEHDCLLFSGLPSGNEWTFQGPLGEERIRVGGRYRVNNSAALAEAVLGGLGIAMTPLWMWRNQPRPLRILLQNYRLTSLPIQLVAPRARFRSARLLALHEFLTQGLSPG